MSWAQGAARGGRERRFGPDDWRWARWRRRGWTMRWTAFELIVMALGFVIFWPIGLAVLAYKFWQGKFGGGDLESFVTARCREARRAWAETPWGREERFGAGSSGNAAFDAWKAAELARLEAERRRLEDAAREFSEFLDRVRRARDREEFERFIKERREREQAGA
jgi:hypothetical protein